MQTITMDKKYNYKNGEAARILCADRPFSGEDVVLPMRSNGVIIAHTITGIFQFGDTDYDLVEVWEPKDKEPVWAWDAGYTTHRVLSFWDNENKCTFTLGDGLQRGFTYDNYAKVKHIEQWMIDTQAKLED